MMHPVLVQLREALRGTPWSGRVYAVGGSVRDELLGRSLKADLDLVLTEDPEPLVRWLFEQGYTECAPQTYPRFGTAMVRMGGAQVEFVQARRESYDPYSRKPEVRPAGLREDAERRDFTINTLLQELESEQVIDPLGRGLEDLHARLLRTPKEPASTFADDPLRMLRAVRLKVQLGFEYAPGLAEAIQEQAERLAIISGERIRDELVKILASEPVDQGLDDLMRFGLMDQFWPEFRDAVGCIQPDFHHLDVWDHTRLVVRNADAGDEVLRLAALLHDVGKPATRTVDPDGRIRFNGHELVGAQMAKEMLQRLRFPNRTIDQVSLLVRNHMRFMGMPKVTDAAARRLVRDLGDELDRLLRLAEADANGLKRGVKRLDVAAIREATHRVEAASPRSALRSPLDGHTLMRELGLEPGPAVGEVQRMLEDAVIEGRLTPGDRAGALEMARAWRGAR